MLHGNASAASGIEPATMMAAAECCFAAAAPGAGSSAGTRASVRRCRGPQSPDVRKSSGARVARSRQRTGCRSRPWFRRRKAAGGKHAGDMAGERGPGFRRRRPACNGAKKAAGGLGDSGHRSAAEHAADFVRNVNAASARPSAPRGGTRGPVSPGRGLMPRRRPPGPQCPVNATDLSRVCRDLRASTRRRSAGFLLALPVT